MDATAFIDLQEALLWFFGPVIESLMIILIAGGLLSAIGAVALDVASRSSR